MKVTPLWLGIALFSALGIGAYFFLSDKKENNNLKSLRNNWNIYITADKGDYNPSDLGGNTPFKIPVQNNTDYVIDKVSLSVDYIKLTGGVFKTEPTSIDNIPPHSVKYAYGPKSSRGKSINIRITEVYSRGLKLCYPKGTGEYLDPYFCQ